MLRFLESIGILTSSEEITAVLFTLLRLLIILSLVVLAGFVSKKVLLRIVKKVVEKSKAKWDDVFLKNRVFDYASYIVPAVVIYVAAPLVGVYLDLIRRLAISYIIIVLALVINAVLKSVNDIYTSYEISKTRPIKGLLQIVKVAMFILMGIVLIATLAGKDPFVLIGGIGAATALFSLIFKDPILGFVAGIQLTGNDMLRIGDWIEVPAYGANGTVVDLTMTTVKVQNFDKTFVHLPAYALISGSFKNWRGMFDWGGRRIIRSIQIDVSSVKFCTDEMIEQYKKIQLLEGYIARKLEEIEQYNEEHQIDESVPINGRRLTNLGTFRAYILNYLQSIPGVNQSMTIMVRQLAPDDKGIYLQIYAFASTTVWVEYEGIQSDIFDHIIAAAPLFDLKIYQQPSSYDFRMFMEILPTRPATEEKVSPSSEPEA
jgi:miniconductance mechanosensitive channel